MRRLPIDYTIERYGLFARLVEENDAEFIVRLRTDPKLSRYLHKTDSSVEAQKEWIRKYKEREEEGTDYYFIFYKDGKAIGLNRLYELGPDMFTSGSWLFSAEAPFGTAFLAQIILREIAFFDWGYEYEDATSGVHVDNTNVLRFDLMAGMKEKGRYMSETGEFISLGLTKEDFLVGRKKILRMLGIKDIYND